MEIPTSSKNDYNETAPSTKKRKIKPEENQIPSIDVMEDDDYPYFMTKDQLTRIKSNNKWIVIQNDALGCWVCKKIQDLGIVPDKNLRLSKVWQECSVVPNGKSVESQQSSLRKKIYEHKHSNAHKRATEILEELEKKETDSADVEDTPENQYLTTEIVFRSVYKNIKYHRPFTDLSVDIELQKLNGISFRNFFCSEEIYYKIANHISSEMKSKICNEIISSKKKISVILDESSAISKSPCLVVVLKTFLSDFPGDAEVFNLDLIQLSDTSTNNVCLELLNCLNKHGFDECFLNECFIGFACDGASVTLGKNGGVAELLKIKFPNLIIWHCANHRLEHSVSDTVNEVSGTDYFQRFMDKLYNLYNRSPKNQRELKEVASRLDNQLKIGNLFSSHWASNNKIVNAVINNYVGLCEHFTQASSDSEREERERRKYKELQRILTNIEFVRNLHIMADALDELSDLSLSLQRRNITLLEADKSVKTTIRVLDSMTCDYGTRLSNIINELNLKSFKGIPLHDTDSKTINITQFFKTLANNLRNRITTMKSSLMIKNEKEYADYSNTYNNYLECLKSLDPKTWPKNDEESDIKYGEKHVRSLCSMFHLNEKNTVRGFIYFKMNEGSEIPEDLKPLFKAVATIPISTSECERNFNSINEIIKAMRCSLSVNTLSDLLFIHSVGPPLQQFKPGNYIHSWLEKGYQFMDETSKKRESKKDATFENIWKIL